MAAIVRSGARRLARSALVQRAPAAGALVPRAPAAGALVPRAPAAGALVQRTQASGVDALCRPFLARFMSSTMQHARAPPESLSKALEEIQVKKEELYDLIAKSGRIDRRNRQLLKSLAPQIKPRPTDYQWRRMRALELTGDVIKSSIPLAGSILFCLAMLEVYFAKSVANKKKQQVDAALAEEEKVSVANRKKQQLDAAAAAKEKGSVANKKMQHQVNAAAA